MDYTTHVLAHQLPINDENYELKLKEVADQINKDGLTQANIFSQLPNICEAVVSHTHLAFLLEDGRVCRLNYSIENDHKEANITNESTATATTSLQTNTKSTKIKVQNTSSGSITSANTTSNINNSNQNTSTTTTTTAGAVAAAVALASSTLNNTNTNTTLSNQSQFRPQSRSGFRSHETFIIPAATEILAPISTHSFGRG